MLIFEKNKKLFINKQLLKKFYNILFTHFYTGIMSPLDFTMKVFSMLPFSKLIT